MVGLGATAGTRAVKSADLERLFPRLPNTDYRITSPADQYYNCVAWAARDTSRCWWPAFGYYWPQQAPKQNTVAAFVEAFAERPIPPRP